MEKQTIRNLIFTALFIVLYWVGAYIKIPVGPVPIALTNMFIILAGLFLGPFYGLASVFIYLLLGAIGVPVFTGGGSFALFAGPTGGFLIGYLFNVFITGLIASRGRKTVLKGIIGAAAGTIALHLCGVAWLKIKLDLTWVKAVSMGSLPFLPGDGLKIAAAAALWRSLLPLWERYSSEADIDEPDA